MIEAKKEFQKTKDPIYKNEIARCHNIQINKKRLRLTLLMVQSAINILDTLKKSGRGNHNRRSIDYSLGRKRCK